MPAEFLGNLTKKFDDASVAQSLCGIALTLNENGGTDQ
jgi:hypothetical protein